MATADPFPIFGHASLDGVQTWLDLVKIIVFKTNSDFEIVLSNWELLKATFRLKQQQLPVVRTTVLRIVMWSEESVQSHKDFWGNFSSST